MWVHLVRPHCMCYINCKYASKEVAPLRLNIAPPATEDTTLLTHAQSALSWYNVTFVFNKYFSHFYLIPI